MTIKNREHVSHLIGKVRNGEYLTPQDEYDVAHMTKFDRVVKRLGKTVRDLSDEEYSKLMSDYVDTNKYNTIDDKRAYAGKFGKIPESYDPNSLRDVKKIYKKYGVDVSHEQSAHVNTSEVGAALDGLTVGLNQLGDGLKQTYHEYRGNDEELRRLAELRKVEDSWYENNPSIQESPRAGAAGRVVGDMVPDVVTAFGTGGVGTLAKVPRLAGVARAILPSAAASGISGGTEYIEGSQDNNDQRMSSAIESALIGGGVAGTFSGLGGAITALRNTVDNLNTSSLNSLRSQHNIPSIGMRERLAAESPITSSVWGLAPGVRSHGDVVDQFATDQSKLHNRMYREALSDRKVALEDNPALYSDELLKQTRKEEAKEGLNFQKLLEDAKEVDAQLERAGRDADRAFVKKDQEGLSKVNLDIDKLQRRRDTIDSKLEDSEVTIRTLKAKQDSLVGDLYPMPITKKPTDTFTDLTQYGGNNSANPIWSNILGTGMGISGDNLMGKLVEDQDATNYNNYVEQAKGNR